jgi:hypothetical protein
VIGKKGHGKLVPRTNNWVNKKDDDVIRKAGL